MLRDPAVVCLLLACACAYVWSKRRPAGRETFPTNLIIRDPIPSREGRFVMGVYLPDEGDTEQAVWDPWEGGGEQHLAGFGTTGSGKTIAARLLAVTAKENWDWRVIAADGAKGGIDFTFMRDSKLGLVVTKGAIPKMLAEQAKEIERRAALLDTIRVGRVDEETGIEYADAPASLRDVPQHMREMHGLKPTLVIIDELAMLLAEEKGQKGEPISGPLRRIAATGRFAGIHLVCIMQRGDADLLDGFIGNLLRARMLIGSTDQTAESMAHGASSMKVWAELMAAEGYEPDGMERVLRPAGRAFVSGLAARPPGLVQLYRFKSLNRHMTMTKWREQQDAAASVEPTPPDFDPSPDDPSAPSPGGSFGPRPGTDAVRSGDYAPGGAVSAPPPRPSSGPGFGPSDPPAPSPPRHRLEVFARRLWLRLSAWRLLFAPLVTDPPRNPALRGMLFAADRGRCSVCAEVTADWEAEHTRPLGRGGADSLRNMTTMCRSDHRIKSRAEARVRAVSVRFRERVRRFMPSGRPDADVAVAGVIFLAGVITTRWIGWTILALVVLCWGPPTWRRLRPWWTGHSSKATNGANNYSDFDRAMEERQPGPRGRFNRTYWWGRDGAQAARYVPMAACFIYLAGVFVRHFTDDTLIVAARILF